MMRHKKQYILIHFNDLRKDPIILINNAEALEYIVEISDEIEYMRFVDLLLPE